MEAGARRAESPYRGGRCANRRSAQSSATVRPPINTRPAGLAGDGITGMPGRVAVGARVFVAVPVAVTVPVDVTVAVIDGVRVVDGVNVTDGVCETVAVFDGVGDGPVVGVSVTVAVLVRVAVFVGARVLVGVAVGNGGKVGGVLVEVRVPVEVAVAVRVALAVAVADTVLVGCDGPTVSWPLAGSQVGVPSLSRQPFGISTIWFTVKVLNVSGVTPLAMPVNVTEKSVPLPDTGVEAHAAVMVSRPGSAMLITVLSQAVVSGPRWTAAVVRTSAIASEYVMLSPSASTPETLAMVMSTTVVWPTVLMTALLGRLTCTAMAAGAVVTRRAAAPRTHWMLRI